MFPTLYPNYEKIKNVAIIEPTTAIYRNVSDYWFKQVSALDDEWFKSADQLNSLRNGAAHAFDSEEIYQRLNIESENKLDSLKNHCKKLFKTIVGLKD